MPSCEAMPLSTVIMTSGCLVSANLASSKTNHNRIQSDSVPGNPPAVHPVSAVRAPPKAVLVAPSTSKSPTTNSFYRRAPQAQAHPRLALCPLTLAKVKARQHQLQLCGRGYAARSINPRQHRMHRQNTSRWGTGRSKIKVIAKYAEKRGGYGITTPHHAAARTQGSAVGRCWYSLGICK